MKVAAIAVVAVLGVVSLVMIAVVTEQPTNPCGAAATTLTEEQNENAAIIIKTGQELGLSGLGQAIALATALVESDLRNLNSGDRDSLGLFQQRPSQGWGTPSQITNPEYAATKFYEALVEIEGWETEPPGDVAQAVQRSAFPDRYGQRMNQAVEVLRQLGGGSPTIAVDCEPGEATGKTEAVAAAGASGTASITVDTSIASNLRLLLADAANDGIYLGGWGYRDPASQIRLRRQHCGTSNYAIYERPSGQCRPPTARPGTSQHEKGLAIDFTCAGARIAGTKCFTWLQNNAARYGLKNFEREPWHWSTTGR